MLYRNLKRYRDTVACQEGIALLMVIWILTILMVIVLSFSLMAKVETQSTFSYKEGMENKFTAEAGVERGIMELFYRHIFKNLPVEFEGKEAWKTDGRPYNGQIGDGYYTVRITDESGKIDINTASDIILKNLMVNFGIQPEDADIIVDSIMDWRDQDDLHRLHGAEDDYYMSLPNPYKAKNAAFDTLEELLLVKGMTPGILYGDGDKKGILEFLTVHSHKSKINIKAAPKEVLMTIPGMTTELADAIIENRQNDVLDDFQQIQGIMEEYISLDESNTFTIDAAGFKNAEKGAYAIKATVIIADNNKHRFIYYKSPATIKK